MSIVKRDALVPQTPAQMYSLVNDIKCYPDFLPWCTKADILSEDEDEIRATLHLAKGAVRKSFTTCNRLQQDKMIEIRLLDGPFRQLEGFWLFEPVANDGCHVKFSLEFELSNKILAMAFGPIFHQIANTFVSTFCQRAKEVYK